VEIRRTDPGDASAFTDWYALLRATDLERWPDVAGWDEQTVKAMASLRDGATEFQCLAALDEDGLTRGIGLFELPRRDNLHGASLDVRVDLDHRRRGIGTAIVAEAHHRARAAGRTALGGISEVPTARRDTDVSAQFALSQGFSAIQGSHRRHLPLPVDPDRLADLRDEVAKLTVGYRIFAFTAPWPSEYLNDQCELARRMSTDAPNADARHEEEVWDAARVKEMDDLLLAQGLLKVTAVAEHLESGRLVAFSEIAVPEHRTEGWQWATLVLREHRGHRLGLAVKLANLDYLTTTVPTVRLLTTSNAAENAPMIDVNRAMGFEEVAEQTVWLKDLDG
jgi:GNAT superfamily N-acetyltransferase